MKGRSEDGTFTVNFSGNRSLGSKGAVALFRAMETNPNFKSLNIEKCPIGDEGVEAMCNHLRRLALAPNNNNGKNNNSTACCVRLERSKITAKGLQAVMKLMVPDGENVKPRAGEEGAAPRKIVIRELTVTYEKGLKAADTAVFVRTIIEHCSHSLRVLKLGDIAMSESDFHLFANAIHANAFPLLKELSLSGRHASPNAPATPSSAYVRVAHAIESCVLHPRKLHLGYTGRKTDKFNQMVERRRRFRFVVSTGASTPRPFLGGGQRDLVALMCDYFCGPLMFNERTGDWMKLSGRKPARIAKAKALPST